jgi:hypothetical protein
MSRYMNTRYVSQTVVCEALFSTGHPRDETVGRGNQLTDGSPRIPHCAVCTIESDLVRVGGLANWIVDGDSMMVLVPCRLVCQDVPLGEPTTREVPEKVPSLVADRPTISIAAIASREFKEACVAVTSWQFKFSLPTLA